MFFVLHYLIQLQNNVIMFIVKYYRLEYNEKYSTKNYSYLFLKHLHFKKLK